MNDIVEIMDTIRGECAAIHERYYQLKMRLGGDPAKFQELTDRENAECDLIYERFFPRWNG